MLESEIKKLTAAVEANTAALSVGGTDPFADGPVKAVGAEQVAAAAAPAAVDLTIDIPVDAKPEAAVTLKQITEGIVELCKAKGRESAAMLMAEYGAQKVPDLKKVSDKYTEIFAKIHALITAK